MIDPSVRKQVYHLTAEDLDDCPVWEWALDEEGVEGQDEATVRPATADIADLLDGQCVAKASFTLADGSRLSGFLTPSSDVENLGLIQPIIVTPHGHVGFWQGMSAPSAEALADSYRLLGKSASAVFPLTFRLDTKSEIEVAGSVPGFLVLKDFMTGEVDILS